MAQHIHYSTPRSGVKDDEKPSLVLIWVDVWLLPPWPVQATSCNVQQLQEAHKYHTSSTGLHVAVQIWATVFAFQLDNHQSDRTAHDYVSH